MNGKATGRVHWSFWVIGAIALVWNAMGVLNFFMQMDADMVATYPESHRAIIEGQPLWATGAFAIAVFGGTLGSLLLLLRKPAAYLVFIASLLGTIAVQARTVGLDIDFSPFDIVLIILMPLVVAAFLAWYSRWTGNRNWIRQNP